ncbi:MAG: hypothetical protein AAGH72_09840 [Verrucomicrobiota bacterium]
MCENREPEKEKQQKEADQHLARRLGGGIFILWAFGVAIPHIFFEKRIPDVGTLGDSAGLINSLFTGLAFAGLIYTILLQMRELKHQREDLKLQREELKETKDVFKQQKDIMDEQLATMKAENDRAQNRFDTEFTPRILFKGMQFGDGKVWLQFINVGCDIHDLSLSDYTPSLKPQSVDISISSLIPKGESFQVRFYLSAQDITELAGACMEGKELKFSVDLKCKNPLGNETTKTYSDSLGEFCRNKLLEAYGV